MKESNNKNLTKDTLYSIPQIIVKRLGDLTIEELGDICEENHSSCNDECPVFELSKKNYPESCSGFINHPDGSKCTCFKDGQKMRDFINKNLNK